MRNFTVSGATIKTYVISFEVSDTESIGHYLKDAPEYWGDPVLDNAGILFDWAQWEDVGKADITHWALNEEGELDEQIGTTLFYLDKGSPRPQLESC